MIIESSTVLMKIMIQSRKMGLNNKYLHIINCITCWKWCILNRNRYQYEREDKKG